MKKGLTKLCYPVDEILIAERADAEADDNSEKSKSDLSTIVFIIIIWRHIREIREATRNTKKYCTATRPSEGQSFFGVTYYLRLWFLLCFL